MKNSTAEQIEKDSKRWIRITPNEVKFAKKMHRRSLRRFAKNIDNPHPQPNRYSGWIG